MIEFLLVFALCVGAVGFGFLWGAKVAHKTIALDCQYLGGFRTAKAAYNAYKTKDIPARK